MRRQYHAVVAALAISGLASRLTAQSPSGLDPVAARSTPAARAAQNADQGGAAGGCAIGEIPDCNGTCAPEIWVGDGVCDNGAFPWPEIGGTLIFLNCDLYGCDGGDCTPSECSNAVCGNGTIEAGESCDDGNTIPGDGCSATCMIESTSTYSVQHMVGEEIAGTGDRLCYLLTDPILPGEPDDIVTFDGILENLATHQGGVVPNVDESETLNPDGTISVSVWSAAPTGTDLFPTGFVSPGTGNPLTGACWFIGTEDLLDRAPPLKVLSAVFTLTSNGTPVLGPTDATNLFSTSPWDGFFGVWVSDMAGQTVNGVQLDFVYAPGTCSNGTCDTGETCQSCPSDCGPCGSACPGEGGCCEANGTPGCEDTTCCETICAADPFCCGNDPFPNGFWDSVCADAAVTDCPGAPSCTGAGDCCAPHAEPGCDDAACQANVCNVDSFCCVTQWDEICVEEASQLCNPACTTGGCCWDASCPTPGTCEAPILCGPAAGCACFERFEGGSGCTEIVDDCGTATPCPNGSSDCPAGQQCYINNCCGQPTCFADCALAGRSAEDIGEATTNVARAARLHAGAAARGPVLHCTDSTAPFCTVFGGGYQGDGTACAQPDICVTCPQAAVLDLAALAASEYPCQSTLSRTQNNRFRLKFDIPITAPVPGEIEIFSFDPVTGAATGADLSSSFDFTTEESVSGSGVFDVIKISEQGQVLQNNIWYAISNVGWCDAQDFVIKYGVARGDADGLGGTGFNDLQSTFNRIGLPLPPNAKTDSSRHDVDSLGGIGFNDLQTIFNNIPSALPPLQAAASGCTP